MNKTKPVVIPGATIDRQAGAGYIYLRKPKPAFGCCVRTVEIEDTGVLVDFDRDGYVMGIEILNLKRMPPAIRKQATDITNKEKKR